jgi:hypothetical protein
MTPAVAEILKEVELLSVPEKAELADHLAGCLWSEISPSIEQTQLDTVKRRISEVESGKVELIPGPLASAKIRQAISQAAQ